MDLPFIKSCRYIAIWAWTIGACLSGADASFAQAAEVPPQPAAAETATPTAEEKAREVIAKHCVGCHERAWLWRGMTTVLGNPVDLAALLQHPDGAVPGRPDASRLYTVMLSGHAHAQPVGPRPTAEEIDAVRTWIAEASPRAPAACTQRQITLTDLGRMLERLRQPGGDALKGIRFVSLAGDQNACASAAELATRRNTIRNLLLKLRTGTAPLEVPLAADDLPVVAVRLADLGWPAARWDAVAAEAAAPEISDVQLADAYGTATPLVDAPGLASAANALGYSFVLGGREGDARAMATSLHQDQALVDLIITGRTDVDLIAAAQDVGLPSETLAAILQTIIGTEEGAARALLREGRISRRAWHTLRAQVSMPGVQGPLRYAAGAPQDANGRLEIYLWSDKSRYRRGDLVVLTAQPNRDCHLNIINIDPRGEATVLFPSDSDPDNLVKAGTKVRIPSDVEPYQLRANNIGSESFVAVCAVNRKRLLGVDQDFEKQRFSILGDWRQFLLTRQTREQLVGRNETPRERRARLKAESTAAAAAKLPEREARTAITLFIED